MPQPWERDWSGQGGGAPWERSWIVPPQEKAPTAGFSLTDIGVSGARGVLGVTKAITDVFGADNPVSQQLQDYSGQVAKLYTPERQREIAYYEQKAKEAEETGGPVEEFKAALNAVKAAPLQATAEAVGSLVPNLASLFIPVVGEARGVAMARSAYNMFVGILEGTGAVKGSIYEGVKDELIKNKVPPEEAEKIAAQAQSYTGKNFDQIMLGSGLGLIAGKYGAEEMLSPKASRLAQKAAAIGSEIFTEAGQASQEKFASNLASLREGMDVDLSRGIIGAATREGLMGGLGAGIVGAGRPGAAPEEAPPTTTIPSQFAPTPEPGPEAGPPLLLEDKGVFRPVGLPDGTVAMTREDLARYEEEQFRKKYEPQQVETLPPEVPVPPVAEERPLSFATATQEIAALKGERQTPEVRERIRELQAYKMDLLMDQMRRAQQPVRPELVELRRQMESGALSADRIDEVMDAVMADLREKKPPKAAEQAALEKEIAGTEKDVAKELAELKKESLAKSKEASKLGTARGEEYNLGTFLKNKLTRDDVIDINPEKSFAKKYLAPKNVVALELADMVADGKLDAWLPPNMRTESETFDEKDATEYIKEQLRQGEFRVYDAQNQQRLLGEEVSRIDERIKQLEAARKATKELPEMTAEERQQEAAALAAQAGFQGAPMEVAAVPEEQEEYFPDQEELPQGQGRLAEKLDVRTPEFGKFFGKSKVVDDQGNPKVVYHGTVVNQLKGKKEIGNIYEFDRLFSTNVRAPSIDTVGIWFSTNPGKGGAEMYAGKGPGSTVYPVYLSIQNPHTTTFEMMQRRARLLENGVDDGRKIGEKEVNAYRKWLKSMGKDGIHIVDDPGAPSGSTEFAQQDAWIALEPNQIKSVFNKRPTEKPGILEEKTEFVINKDKEHERIEKELTGKTMLQVAQWTVDNAPNQFAKVFAQKVLNRLNGMAARGIKLEFKIHGGQSRPNDMYRARGLTEFDFGKPGEKKLASITIRLNGAAALDNQNGYPPGTRYITVLHELLHASTVGQTRLLKSTDPIVKELRDLFNQVVQHFNTEARAGRLTPFMEKIFAREINALESPDELLAWGIADEDMQRFLSDIKVGEKTIMDKLVELIRKILNITKPYLTALDQLVRTTESILDEDVNVVGDKIISRQYSFGVKPGGQPVQGTLFEEAGPSLVSKAAKKVAEKIEGVGKKPGLTPEQGFGHVDPNYLEKLKPFFAPEGKTFADKMETYKDRTFQRLAQGIADQYRTIKDYSPLAYIKARMSKTVDGALEGLTFYGQVKLTDGALDIKQGTDGLVKMLEPIGNEVNSFLIWRALSRDFNIVEKSKRTQEQIEGIESDIQQLLNSKKEINKVFEAKLKDHLEQMVKSQKVLDQKIKNVIEDQSLSTKEKRSLISSMEREFNKQKEEGISTLRKESDKNKKTVDQQIAVERATIAKLKETIKLPSISPEVVAQRNELAVGKIGNESRLEVYNRVSRELNKLNKSVLDIALEKGQIDKRSYETFLQDIYYIPFYKMVEDGQVADIRTASGLANQYFSKALKGGEKPFGDLMENLLRNWNHILSASMKNDAAVETLKAATEAGAAYPNLKVQFEWKDGQVYSKKGGDLIPAGEVDGIKYAEGELRPGLYSSDGKSLVKVMMNGYPAYYEVIDPLLVESIMSIGYMGPKSKFLDMARDFKNILQYGVTLSPAFKVRNLIRDSVQSAAISPIGLNIGKNVTEGLAASKKGNPDYISALAGGAIFNFGSYMEGDQARQVKRLIKQGVNPDNILNTEAKIKNGLKKMYDAYQELGNRSEAANRMALYKQLRAKGLSHLEASFQARDLLDFSMQGAWPAVRLVTQVIPFLNARIQGLYKLGRDGIIPTSRVLYNSVTGKPLDLTDKQKAQQFSIVTGATVLASLMLYMAFKDDDEFKKREQWDRDNFWWFRLPGMEAAIRIPKPFEIGAMGTFAERIAEQMFDEGAEGRVFEQSMKRMLTDTFAINPIPQMIKPLVDLYANKDSFTGAPIETAGMERLSKAERVAVNTSPLAKALSQVANVFLPEATEVSPVQTDYAIKAYLGWMGATISATSHYAVMPFSKSAYPDHNWTDTMSLGFVRTLPANQSGYVTSFYENMKTIEQAYADMRHYAELGQAEKVQQILEEKGDKIQLAKFYDKTSKDMAKVRQAIQSIQNDETMDGAQKREEIDRLKQLIGDLAKQAEDVRKSLRQ